MPIPEKLFILIDQFKRNLHEFHNGGINEATLRQEYINPFFALLGCDVDNSPGYSPAYREVVHEDTVEVNGRKKAPDYSFRIGDIRKFFVEAKVPARNIKDDWKPAFQLRRYG
jgi:predicted type IV restriction endonuclease